MEKYRQTEILLDRLRAESPEFFRRDKPVHLSRAPGRLDLMGGIADYSGSLVFQWPLEVAVACAAQVNDSPECECISWIQDETQPHRAAFPLDVILDVDSGVDRAAAYTKVRKALGSEPAAAWAAYTLGTLSVLRWEKGLLPENGIRLAFFSDVPLGAGVSSSAALEVAAFYAVGSAYGVEPGPDEAAILCQMVENYVVGAPCGIMDQMTAAYGEAGMALPLLCQPHQRRESVALPGNVEIWGIHSGERHAVGGSDYTAVRVGAFMGYQVIASLRGFDMEFLEDSRFRVEDPEFHGYLANVSPSLFESRFRHEIPESMRGEDFLAVFDGITDPATKVDPGREYRILAPTAHPVYEHHRVSLFAEICSGSEMSAEELALAGELMYQSHASYSACGLGSPGTDRLVEMVRRAGPNAGLYGAKITGGGSGGTVAILGRRGSGRTVQALARTYAAENGHGGLVLSGSSPGAEHSGVRTFDW